jgi:hypothetical protein
MYQEINSAPLAKSTGGKNLEKSAIPDKSGMT